LIDDNGNDVTDFEVRGELCVRGPSVIPGYYNNPKANAESWDNEGYFKTGDIVYCDQKTKKWYIVDRKKVSFPWSEIELSDCPNNTKELIKVRGFQVAPPELEGVLLSHPDIVDCAVIGIKGAPNSDTEFPRAYVVRRAGSEITEAEVKRTISEQLAAYKQLTGGVRFVNEIPKSASGKILKKDLRAEVEKETVMEKADIRGQSKL
jgi:4-coumarate--CoA ligase